MNVSVLDNCVGCGACAIINSEVFEIKGNKAVVNSDKMCNLLMTVAYKKRLLAEKKLNENQASKVHN